MISRRSFTRGAVGVAALSAVPTLAACGSQPAAVGEQTFWMPEESEPHERTFMQWPVSRAVHPDSAFLDMLQQTIADAANAIADFEPVEAKILEAVGGTKMIWAPGVKGQDITEYHIDSLARFTEPGRVLIQLPPEEDTAFDDFAASAYETHDELAEASDANGEPLKIVVLLQPSDAWCWLVRDDCEDADFGAHSEADLGRLVALKADAGADIDGLAVNDAEGAGGDVVRHV